MAQTTPLQTTNKSTIVRSFSHAAPRTAGWAAMQLFFQTPRRRPVSSKAEQEVLGRAHTLEVRTANRTIRAYTWGSGPPVLLVHGWGGAASQLHAFVDPLVRSGHRVVSFDLPGHGGSSGWSTHLIEVAGIVAGVARWTGPLRGVVAHSLGAAAVGVAISEGLQVERVVLIGAAVEPAGFWQQFVGRLGLSRSAVESGETQIARRVGRRLAEVSMRKSLGQATQPTLVVHDTGDRWASVEDARSLADLLAHGRYFETQGSGHTRILADVQVVERVTQFLSSRRR